MTELFGVSMTNIALGCVVATGLIFAVVAWIAIRNPVMFKTGLRNIPRRPLQTALIFMGLMLSTLIITAAFGTGDTLSSSLTDEIYTILGPVDHFVEWDTDKQPAPEDDQVIPLTDVDELRSGLGGSVKAVLPIVASEIPVQNTRTRLSEANGTIVAVRREDMALFGGLKTTGGKAVTLGPGEIALNKELASELDAKVGDTVRLFNESEPTEFRVVAIVPNTLLGGTFGTDNRTGGAIDWDAYSALKGRSGATADLVAISVDGSSRGGLERSRDVARQVEGLIGGKPYQVEEAKRESLEFAQLIGSLFTTVFIIFGLFSIAAGILLIFLIFVMLAAERKPEMGMARAVGAKRRQIVESFLAEGMGYDLGSALLGMVAGIGVAALMVGFVNSALGDDLGIPLQFSIAPRSVIVALCAGIIVTFIVVFFASWRASRLNIVAAIRDLPETKPHNPEAATVIGYLRAALNGYVAFGFLVVGLLGMFRFQAAFPYWLLCLVTAMAGLWVTMVRNHNFGAPKALRKVGERLPIWPWFLVGIGWITYPLAILVVAIVRDRRPKSLPPWLVVGGLVLPPLGLVLAAMQDKGKPVAWATGFAAVALGTGAMFLQWGLNANRMAWFALGMSLIAFGIALSLRHFHVRERPVFTVTSIVLMVMWFLLPGGRLKRFFGELNADAEMFFITGAVLVTCGTFLVVYNADIILPAIAKLGNRFGRLAPAVKTAVAYPLTSKFRTGLTIAMIGLIVFVLTLQSAMNTNFERVFTGDDALGGWDVRVAVNPNNQVEDFRAALAKGNEDPTAPAKANLSSIATVGEVRNAFPFETNVEDPREQLADDELPHIFLHGVDESFAASQRIPLQYRAAGYASDEAVWKAVGSGGNFAIISALMTQPADAFGPPSDEVLRLPESATSAGFQPFDLTLVDRATGRKTQVTVIGQAKDGASTFWPGNFISKQTLGQAFPEARGQEFYLQLQPGVDANRFAQQVEGLLVQVQAESTRQVIADGQAANRAFLRLFQGFLGLGLLVGIAALGVISLRAVVERRQQIGMLRAIGYKRSMVQLSFLMEAGFIALSGIILGMVLGLGFGATLFTSGEFGASTAGLSFTVPWTETIVTGLIAFVAAMLTTWWPARAASHVAVAEALRYE